MPRKTDLILKPRRKQRRANVYIERLAAVWDDLSPRKKVQFAAAAKTTPGSLVHVVKGRRTITIELAQRLEAASVKMSLPLTRVDLHAACASCAYAKFCLGLVESTQPKQEE